MNPYKPHTYEYTHHNHILAIFDHYQPHHPHQPHLGHKRNYSSLNSYHEASSPTSSGLGSAKKIRARHPSSDSNQLIPELHSENILKPTKMES
jgi:hypothetical protein